jgi:hypothetical protein
MIQQKLYNVMTPIPTSLMKSCPSNRRTTLPIHLNILIVEALLHISMKQFLFFSIVDIMIAALSFLFLMRETNAMVRGEHGDET